MLNGKCKEDFNRYLESKKHPAWCMIFHDRPDIVKVAYITEWFDSVGIYINIENLDYQNWWYFKVKSIPFKYEEKTMIKSRLQAQIKAIEKANEIYNNRYEIKN